MLARYAAVARASILGLSGGLFSDAARPCQRPAPVVSKNTNELKIGTPGRFGID